MRKPLPIIVLWPMLLLASCAPALQVRPALPICPEPIRLPRSMTDPLPLPSWFPAPKPTTTFSLPQPRAPPECTKTPST